MNIMLVGYVCIGAIIALAVEVVMAVVHFKVGYYDTLSEYIYSMKWYWLCLCYFIDLFTWPERVVSILWYVIFKKIVPWRRLLFGDELLKEYGL